MDEQERELTPDEMEEYQEMQEEMEEDAREDGMDDQHDSQIEFQEGYGPPEQEEKHNSHTFLNKAAFVAPDTLRTTFLDTNELGKPIFNIRFLLDMEDISDFYLRDICKKYDLPNGIAEYFRNKIKNITDSGMSKEGFTMNLNTTKNIQMTRTKRKGNIENLKGGESKKYGKRRTRY